MLLMDSVADLLLAHGCNVMLFELDSPFAQGSKPVRFVASDDYLSNDDAITFDNVRFEGPDLPGLAFVLVDDANTPLGNGYVQLNRTIRSGDTVVIGTGGLRIARRTS